MITGLSHNKFLTRKILPHSGARKQFTAVKTMIYKKKKQLHKGERCGLFESYFWKLREF